MGRAEPRRRDTRGVLVAGVLAATLLPSFAGAAPAFHAIVPPDSRVIHVIAAPDARAPHTSVTGAAPTLPSDTVLSVKLREELGARVSEGSLVDPSGRPMRALTRALTTEEGAPLRPLISLSPGEIRTLVDQARALDGRPVPDLNSWIRVDLPPGADAAARLRELSARGEVDTAYLAPSPAPPPSWRHAVSPDLTEHQTYFGPAPTGIDAVFAREQPGGDGRGVRIVEIERDWVLEHEDLGLADGLRVSGACSGGPLCFPDHGTSVLGVLVARENAFGVTGGVPEADIRLLAPVFDGQYDPAGALARAGRATRPGDVILVELQTSGPEGPEAFVPIEWIPEVYETILVLTRAGRVVIEPAGNGGRDLDATVYEGRFDRRRFHSGAILVGGGDPWQAALPISNHGSRLDLQGWGCCVTTTGAGDEELPRTVLAHSYRREFGGTSSAAAIVAAAAASLQGVARAARGVDLTGPQIAALLRRTGTPSRGTRRIGPLPDLREAITRFTTFEAVISAEDAVQELLEGGRLTPEERRHLDALGNDDGHFDAGDVAALLDRQGDDGGPR